MVQDLEVFSSSFYGGFGSHRFLGKLMSERLRDRHEAAMDADLDLQTEKSAERLLKASAGAFSSAEEARQCWNSLEQAELRKSRLQAELRSLQSQQRQHQTRIHAFVKEEQREKALTERLLQLQHAEMQLGLPHIDIDHRSGICYLGDPPATGEVPQRDGRDGETEALRSIKVEFDEEGTLLHAEPHPSLGLENCAAQAVAQQDFAILPTMVWNHLCDAGKIGSSPEDALSPLQPMQGARGGA